MKKILLYFITGILLIALGFCLPGILSLFIPSQTNKWNVDPSQIRQDTTVWIPFESSTPKQEPTKTATDETFVAINKGYGSNISQLHSIGRYKWSQTGYEYTYYSNYATYDKDCKLDSICGYMFNGFIVCASSMHTKFETVETPWGTGIILDTGCAKGVIDIHTSWDR